MRWFVKATVYATLLTWPGHWIAPAYQSLLIGLTGWLTGRSLAAPVDGAVDLSAANLLSVFVALCLASGFASWSRRLAAIALGLVFLVAVECATGVLGMRLEIALQLSQAQPSLWQRILEQMLELSRWLAVPFAWGVLLGRDALRHANERRGFAPGRETGRRRGQPGEAAATRWSSPPSH
jgi:hypothetical protein